MTTRSMTSDRQHSGRVALASFLIVCILVSISFRRNRLYENSIALWTDVIVHSPRDARAYLNLGAACLKHKPPLVDKVVEASMLAIRLDPTLEEAHFNLANAYGHRHEYYRAIEACLRALTIRPTWAAAHYQLGYLYEKINLNSEAIQAYKNTLALQPYDEKAHRNLGLQYLQQGDLEKADAEFNAILKINPSDQQAQAFLNFMANITRR